MQNTKVGCPIHLGISSLLTGQLLLVGGIYRLITHKKLPRNIAFKTAWSVFWGGISVCVFIFYLVFVLPVLAPMLPSLRSGIGPNHKSTCSEYVIPLLMSAFMIWMSWGFLGAFSGLWDMPGW
jgi:hypothetical protein